MPVITVDDLLCNDCGFPATKGPDGLCDACRNMYEPRYERRKPFPWPAFAVLSAATAAVFFLLWLRG